MLSGFSFKSKSYRYNFSAKLAPERHFQPRAFAEENAWGRVKFFWDLNWQCPKIWRQAGLKANAFGKFSFPFFCIFLFKIQFWIRFYWITLSAVVYKQTWAELEKCRTRETQKRFLSVLAAFFPCIKSRTSGTQIW